MVAEKNFSMENIDKKLNYRAERLNSAERIEIMNITINRHEEYNKFIVTVESNFDVKQFTLYDMTIVELAQFVKTITE